MRRTPQICEQSTPTSGSGADIQSHSITPAPRPRLGIPDLHDSEHTDSEAETALAVNLVAAEPSKPTAAQPTVDSDDREDDSDSSSPAATRPDNAEETLAQEVKARARDGEESSGSVLAVAVGGFGWCSPMIPMCGCCWAVCCGCEAAHLEPGLLTPYPASLPTHSEGVTECLSRLIRKDDGLYIPSEYAEFVDVFSRSSAETLPLERPTDHAIEVELDAVLPKNRLYIQKRNSRP